MNRKEPPCAAVSRGSCHEPVRPRRPEPAAVPARPAVADTPLWNPLHHRLLWLQRVHPLRPERPGMGRRGRRRQTAASLTTDPFPVQTTSGHREGECGRAPGDPVPLPARLERGAAASRSGLANSAAWHHSGRLAFDAGWPEDAGAVLPPPSAADLPLLPCRRAIPQPRQALRCPTPSRVRFLAPRAVIV